MSSRALRRLKGKQRGQEALDSGDLTLGDGVTEQDEEEQLDAAQATVALPPSKTGKKAKKNKDRQSFSNIYELVS